MQTMTVDEQALANAEQALRESMRAAMERGIHPDPFTYGIDTFYGPRYTLRHPKTGVCLVGSYLLDRPHGADSPRADICRLLNVPAPWMFGVERGFLGDQNSNSQYAEHDDEQLYHQGRELGLRLRKEFILQKGTQ